MGTHVTTTAEVQEKLREFDNFIQDSGLKHTRQRRTVAGVVLAHEGDELTLAEILTLARQHNPRIGYATVYRALGLMVDAGLVVRHEPRNAATYEVRG